MKQLNFERFRQYINKKYNYESKEYSIIQSQDGSYKAGSLNSEVLDKVNYELGFVMDPMIHNDSFLEVLALFDEKTT